MNRWWLNQADERYWLESTDREDLGADLNAPLYDDSGCCQSATLGQIGTREDCYCEEPRANSLRVLL